MPIIINVPSVRILIHYNRRKGGFVVVLLITTTLLILLAGPAGGYSYINNKVGLSKKIRRIRSRKKKR
jgi:hypothetical protein